MIETDKKYKMNGLELLKAIPSESVKLVIIDPQYRGQLDKLQFSNEKDQKQKARCNLPQMDNDTINQMLIEIDRILVDSGYVFLWIDKFQLCEGTSVFTKNTKLQIVDLFVWQKTKMGLGFRLRHNAEFCQILQKPPIKAKGTWNDHSILDVYQEAPSTYEHPHAKPLSITKRLIEAATNTGDIVVDPCAGSFTTLQACKDTNRQFIGCDLVFGDVDYIAIQSASLSKFSSGNCTLKLTLDEFKVINAINKSNKITQKELSKIIGKSERTVKAITVSLQNKGLITRINGKRNGTWQVLI